MASKGVEGAAVVAQGMDRLRDLEGEGGEVGAELHVLSEPVIVQGRMFVRCSCRLVVETYGHGLAECPISLADAEFWRVVRDALGERDRVVRDWRRDSEIEQAELERLTA